VQLVLTGTLIVSLGVTSLLRRQPWSGRDWLAALAVVAGVAATTALLGPSGHHAVATGRLAAAALLTGCVALAAAGYGLRTTGRGRAPALATAAGLMDAFVAVVTMAFARTFPHGPVALLTGWPLYALILGGLTSLVLTQTAYQTDTPLVTLPVITTVTPLASLAVGLTVLGESARLDLWHAIALTLCLGVTVRALVALARTAGLALRAGEVHDPVVLGAAQPAALGEHDQVRHGLVDGHDLVEEVQVRELVLAARPRQ
jgi:hypothetical protein